MSSSRLARTRVALAMLLAIAVVLLYFARCTVDPYDTENLFLWFSQDPQSHSLYLSTPAIVRIRYTTYVGARNFVSGVDYFGGIPFAEPPLGELRFAPPVPVAEATELKTVDASEPGLECLQSRLGRLREEDMDENCLTLNIFRPSAVDTNASLPVLVYIYGGGFHGGHSTGYNGTRHVARSVETGTPIIFATMNYRLGPWGFPQGDAPHYNLGLWDQQLALKWIHDNIVLFGGDPTKVTIMGQSAGAESVALHMLNEDSSALFRGAILHSGAADTLPVHRPFVRAPNWEGFTLAAECALGNLTCLRAAPRNVLLAAHEAVQRDPPAETGMHRLFPWGPVMDRDFVRDYPHVLIDQGRMKSDGTGAIAGCLLDEGTIFAPKRLNDTQELDDLLARTYGNASTATLGALVEAYDPPHMRSPFQRHAPAPAGYGAEYTRAAALMGDAWFHAPRRAFSAVAKPRSWAYHLVERASVPLDSMDGLYHGFDLDFVFGSAWVDADLRIRGLARQWADWYIAFVVSGNPNDARSGPKWPEYAAAREVMELKAGNTRAVPDTYRAEPIRMLQELSFY